ncbi:phosphate regulon sensor histidine kinase PhoR [Microbaculum marinum]|uniref:histidine kinase n=1 Tax=Microbaculum marinum TaxID=1764581 RepID=A0AAW9RL32_9HYPH
MTRTESEPARRTPTRASALVRRIEAARWPLAIAAAVFVGCWLFAGLSLPVAALGFAIVAIVLLRHGDANGKPADRATGTADVLDPLAGYAAVADGLPDPCFLIDRAGNVRFQNTTASKLFGVVAKNQPISFVLRAPEVGDAVQRARATGATATVTFFERVPADRWFEARVSPLGDAGPAAPARPAVYLVLLRDLTEAQRVERMRVDFVANASHELRTPLASVTGFIETLQGPARNDADARERFLEIMAVQARRMSRLIDDLMSLSRIELKAHVRPETVVDVAPILEHVADAMHPLAIESGVELKLDIRDRPLSVVGDRDELAQVFQNLVHNAIKYGQSGGRVDVTAVSVQRGAGKPARASVTVRDYGPGIAAEHLPRLTERFYRVDTASSREKGGTGLGLAIVKHILNRHHGQLLIDSKPGEGAEFKVLLDGAENVT